jgi:hypothetical protein
MACYIVVHHPSDTSQPWSNDWRGDTELRTITTPRPVAARLTQAKERGERIFVHRCAWSGDAAEICCSALVEEVTYIDKTTAMVRFGDVRPLRARPSAVARPGLNWYEGAPVAEPSAE